MRFPPNADASDKRLIANDIVTKLDKTFRTGKSKEYEFRMQQLRNLLRFFDENEADLCAALYKDLRKPRHEAFTTEIELTRNEIRMALANLKQWMAPHPAEKNLATMADNPYVHHEPYGVALIIGAWNYPIQLLLAPFVGALAAGNCVILKPSEVAENTERMMEQLLPRYLDNNCFEVVCGGGEDTGLLLEQKFDYIFYTGSTTVGKIVYEAAAKHLTPVTLELGGKSPCFVDSSADLDFSARRIMWGKLMNAGQTCIAPDYVLCTSEVQSKLVTAMKKATKELIADPKSGPDFGRIISDRHFKRVTGLLDNQNVAFGGDSDASTRYVAPTILTDVNPDSRVMQEEIFGPIMPIVPVKSMDEGIEFVNNREKPLALYVFTKDNRMADRIIHQTTSGGSCVNDVIMHACVDTLPFGGIGPSGQGAYHGFFSFETFSHKRAVLWKKHGMDFLLYPRYPPFTETKTKLVGFLLKYRSPLPKWLGTLAIFAGGFASGYILRLVTNPQIQSLLQPQQSEQPHNA